MKELIKHSKKYFIIFAIAAGLIAITSLITPMVVQFTQIFMYMFILLLIPGFIATKELESRGNIAYKAYLLHQKRQGFNEVKNDKKIIQSPPTEIVDNKKINESFGKKWNKFMLNNRPKWRNAKLGDKVSELEEAYLCLINDLNRLHKKVVSEDGK